MPESAIPPPDPAMLDALVARFTRDQPLVRGFLRQILVFIDESKMFSNLIHSVRNRIKDPEHLRDKLTRKYYVAKKSGVAFDITPDNLFTKVADLAGIRLLHLHTTQIAAIDQELRAIITEQKLALVEPPFARTWDDEYREYFRSVGIQPQDSATLYTSVHYVLGSNSRTALTCEIQVRTLMEEVWGEVDHAVNYPVPNEHVACTEQIRALARTTSAATRLVDSIFATVNSLKKKDEP